MDYFLSKTKYDKTESDNNADNDEIEFGLKYRIYIM
jgi:hypothetical protein